MEKTETIWRKLPQPPTGIAIKVPAWEAKSFPLSSTEEWVSPPKCPCFLVLFLPRLPHVLLQSLASLPLPPSLVPLSAQHLSLLHRITARGIKTSSSLSQLGEKNNTKPKTKLLHDPSPLQLSSHYCTQKNHPCTTMFTAAWFITAKG